MNSHSQLSIWSLVLEANIIVQFVMLLLVLMLISVVFIAWKKWILLKLALNDTKKFESKFWSGTDIQELYNVASQKKYTEGLEYIFVSGFHEFNRLRTTPIFSPEFVVENIRRAMEASAQREENVLHKSLSWLATSGSVAPYFGLFGTVIGVMNSFIALGAVKQVTLSQVAPGIAEALIATALGLLVAIPAVMIYNSFVNTIQKISDHYDVFIEEFANILARQYGQMQLQLRKDGAQ